MAAKRKRNQQSQPPHFIAGGSPVRMQPPQSSRNQPQHHMPDIEVVGGFTEFLREHAVVALAIGFVVATQIQALAKQLIASFIDPAFKLLFGEKLSAKTFAVHFHGRVAYFGWGAFVYALMDVMFVLIAIYVAVKIFKLENLQNPKDRKARRPDDDD